MVFAHADISGENVLVDAESRRVTGILDWERQDFDLSGGIIEKILGGGRRCDTWV